VHKFEKTLSLVGLSALVALPAFANPWDHSAAPPPTTMRPEMQMRTNVDGRGDLHEAPTGRAEMPSASRPQAERMTHAQPQLPIRNDVAMRAHPGDQGEDAAPAGPLARKDEVAPAQKPNIDLMGRKEAGPPVQLKTQVMLKLQGEESPESDAAKGSLGQGGASKQRPISAQEQKMLQKKLGMRLPGPAIGSDDPDDKTM
jgi:hypothetical protein